jgi:hypothetical protein
VGRESASVARERFERVFDEHFRAVSASGATVVPDVTVEGFGPDPAKGK